MATRKQTAANRRNAKKSTGPRTDAGKTRSAQNAVTHGLTSRTPILPDEDAAEYAAFAAGVRADIAPMGVLEEALAVRVAEGVWRLLRIGRLEAACFAYELAQASERAARLREIPGLPPSAAMGEEHALGKAFLRLDADGLPNSLARYEAAIQRGVERSMKLLQDTRKLRAAAEKAALRDEADFPVAQVGQGFPAEEPSRSRRAEQASKKQDPEQPSKDADGSRATISPTVDTEAASPTTQADADAREEAWDPWPEARPNVLGTGYAPARPGERIEHRVHGNTRYIVRVPIEDEAARR